MRKADTTMTDRHRFLAAAVLGGALLAGCGGSTETTQYPNTTALPAPSDAPRGEAIGEVAARGTSEAVRRMCESERRTLEMAIDVFGVQYGEPAATVDDLVADGLLREAPRGMHLAPDGSVAPIADGPCA